MTAALRRIPDEMREAVVLHYIADLSVEQIATETGTPSGTVKARLHRGRARLAELLGVADTEPSRPKPTPRRGETS